MLSAAAPARLFRLAASLQSVAAALSHQVLLSFADLPLVLLVEHLCRHHERLLHIVARLGRCLNEKVNTVVLSEALALFEGHFALSVAIRLVPDKYDDRVSL